MDFDVSDEDRMIVDTATRIGEAFGLEYWRKLDSEKAYPREIWAAICQAGLAGVALPVEHGGSGLGMVQMARAIEALTAGGAGATLAQMFMLTPIFGGVAVSSYGAETMRTDLLPKIISGKVRFSMALTEPGAGSNSLEIKTFARQNGEGWLLSGSKIWITGVEEAEKMLVVCRTTKKEDAQRRADGLSLFVIEPERAGVSHHPIEKLGTNTLSSSTVFFEDVALTREDLLGELDRGWPALLDVLNTERIVTTAGLVGAGRLALKLAGEYARNRRVFAGRPIGSYQGVQFPLAQASAEIECASLMNLKAAWLCDQGRPYGGEANVAKLIAAQAASDAIERAMQVYGGMGYAKESHLERLWRDARLFKFAPVSEEMILNFIAQHDLGLPRSY